jgi:hypothetical protein
MSETIPTWTALVMILTAVIAVVMGGGRLLFDQRQEFRMRERDLLNEQERQKNEYQAMLRMANMRIDVLEAQVEVLISTLKSFNIPIPKVKTGPLGTVINAGRDIITGGDVAGGDKTA